MTVHPNARNLVRQMLPKIQPRIRRPKNPGEAKTRALVAARSGGWCEVCGVNRADSVHHRRKRSQGGPWSASNCVATCGDGTRGCHGWAEHNPDAADPEGFHVRPGEDPARKPIVSGFHGVVLLADSGAVTPIEGGAA
jgi:hypothetical protein